MWCGTRFTCGSASLVLTLFVWALWSPAPAWHLRRVADTRCLDGSEAAYYASLPSDGNVSSFAVVHLQAGGWCTSAAECQQRASTPLGSSKSYASASVLNPDSYGSGMLMDVFGGALLFDGIGVRSGAVARYVVLYCDGGSWAGVDGRNTLERTMQSILRSDLSANPRVLVTGCSAGGLAVVHACGWMRRRFPSVTFRCMHDGSLFFGNMSHMFAFHGAPYQDTVQRLVDDGPFFTVTDWYDWDFVTRPVCKQDASACTASEVQVRRSREDILRRLPHAWVTNASHHCQLGLHVTDTLAEGVTSFFYGDTSDQASDQTSDQEARPRSL